MDGITLLWLVSAAASLYVGWRIGKDKGRHGFWWAFWLGWIGVFIVWRLKPLPATTETTARLMTEEEWARLRQPTETDDSTDAWAKAQPFQLRS